MSVKITFVKDSVVIMTQEVPAGCDFQRISTLHPSLPLRFGCRNGDCGVCAMHVMHGMENLTKRTPEEKKTLPRKGHSEEWRLGCQCCVNGDVVIETLA